MLSPDRRDFLKHIGFLTAAGSGLAMPMESRAGGHHVEPKDPFGVLVDLSVCIGCRRCEHACKQVNGIEAGRIEDYDDQSVFSHPRRPTADAFTVINSYPNPSASGKPVYAKVNCLHCNYPSCVSACIVGALRKQESGAVTYDAWKCIGCRYCMVACPFQIPAYDYANALTPTVRRCQFCVSRLGKGEKPACIAACPREVMLFGKRDELIALAHKKIAANPGKYENHVYGEHEVGGTSWMYLSPTPFAKAGFLPVGDDPPPALTEAIQHGVFKHWIAPLGWYGFLATTFWFTGRRAAVACADEQVETDEHVVHEASKNAHAIAAPANAKFLTKGVWILIALVLVGIGFFLYRMVVGLAASTNLDNQHPWGLWIAMDVGSGIALAGGGFVSAAIFHVFHRHHYHMLARSALVTALLGYTFYVPGLLADLGRWYALPITMLPPMWQGNSVLFEVGMCVMIYLNVQYAELAPIVLERLRGVGMVKRRQRAARWLDRVHGVMERVMPALLCLGVCLSTFHQSSLGNLLVIAPYKLHPLWWSPVSPLMFLLSAVMVGLPMVIFTILFASWCLGREPEMEALTPLARRYAPVFVATYLAVKVGDMMVRGTHRYLFDGSADGYLWLGEMMMLFVPLGMLFSPRLCRSPRWLAAACLLVISGVVFNRLNVFVLGFHPPFAQRRYIPSLTEFMVSIGLVAALLLTYRAMVTWLPILEKRPAKGAGG